MAALVRQYRTAPAVREAALSLVRDVPPKDYAGEVRAIFEWVRDHVRYTRDVRDVETVQTPQATLELEQGDCDDKTTLLAALLESVGVRTRLVAVGMVRPGSYSHVYAEAFVRGAWVALDATMPHAVGWAPQFTKSRLTIEV